MIHIESKATILELSTGEFKLIDSDKNILKTYNELPIEIINDYLIGYFEMQYLQIGDVVPEIFTYKINNKFRVLYQNGRVEMLDNNKSSFDKFKGNYKKVISFKSEDYNLIHYITFKDGSTEFLTWEESLTKSFVIKKEVVF